VRVAVANVDVDTRELDFRLISRAGGPKGRVKRPAKSRGKSSAKASGRPKKKIRPGKNERRQKRGR
jgi:hypothetical protein